MIASWNTDKVDTTLWPQAITVGAWNTVLIASPRASFATGAVPTLDGRQLHS
jgi:hypothetical protein